MKNLILTVASVYALNVSAQCSAHPSENMNSKTSNHSILQKTANNDFGEYVNLENHKLKDNEKRIALLKKLAARDFVDKRFESEIAGYEKENSKLKEDLADYKRYGTESCWMAFKGRFDERIAPLRHELATLETNLKDL